MATITTVQSISAITLQGLEGRAGSICEHLANGSFNEASAIQEADYLYQEGAQLVKAEVDSQPLLENVSSITIHLNDHIPWEARQLEFHLHRTLSKAYRIFVELTWYQCWRKAQQPMFEDTRNKTIANSKRQMSVIRPDQVEIWFEYSCAEQAAKCLKPSSGIWHKYIDHVLNIGGAAEGRSFFGVIRALKALAMDAGKDWVKGWYIDVHHLRWVSSRVLNKADFDEFLEPEISSFQTKGRYHTLCLTAIFRDLIKNPQTDRATKELAARHIAHLLKLEDKDKVEKIMDYLLQKCKRHSQLAKPIEEYIKKYDKYWATRMMILQSTEELIREDQCKPYIPTIIEAVVEKRSRNVDERRKIQETLNSLQQQEPKLSGYINQLKEYFAKINTRAEGVDSNEVEKQEKNYKDAQRGKEILDLQIKTLKAINPILDNLDLEEQKYAQSLSYLQGVLMKKI